MLRDIEIDDSRLTQAIGRLTALGRDASPMTGLISELMLGAVEDNFAAEGRPHWLGLSPKTLKRYRETAGEGKLLQRSGRLASSVVKEHGPNSATVGTNVVYAAIHQFGGTIERHPMSGYVRLRKGRNGMILRQANHPNLAVFAKNGHKSVKLVRWTRSSGWTIKIAARPFLQLAEADSVNIEMETTLYLRRLIEG